MFINRILSVNGRMSILVATEATSPETHVNGVALCDTVGEDSILDLRCRRPIRMQNWDRNRYGVYVADIIGNASILW
jgi:hypothetical protein